MSKRVKTEGDVNETLIKQLVHQVDLELADVENGVRAICVHYLLI